MTVRLLAVRMGLCLRYGKRDAGYAALGALIMRVVAAFRRLLRSAGRREIALPLRTSRQGMAFGRS